MTNWTRRFEIISLTGTTWTPPLTFLILGIFWIFYVLPAINAPIINSFLIFVLFFEGISWNTRFGVGGRAFMTPFTHYLKHEETEKDKKLARFTFLFFLIWPWLIIGLFGLFFRLFFVK